MLHYHCTDPNDNHVQHYCSPLTCVQDQYKIADTIRSGVISSSKSTKAYRKHFETAVLVEVSLSGRYWSLETAQEIFKDNRDGHVSKMLIAFCM